MTNELQTSSGHHLPGLQQLRALTFRCQKLLADVLIGRQVAGCSMWWTIDGLALSLEKCSRKRVQQPKGTVKYIPAFHFDKNHNVKQTKKTEGSRSSPICDTQTISQCFLGGFWRVI